MLLSLVLVRHRNVNVITFLLIYLLRRTYMLLGSWQVMNSMYASH